MPLNKFFSALFTRRPKDVITGDTKLDRFQRAIGYKFTNASLLKHALTHKSFAGHEDAHGLLSNERLEFLGDSVVNCLVTEYLYFTNPDKSEGSLSKMKSLIVSRKILGEIALDFDLGNFLIMSPSEERTGGRARASTMSNAFEAVIGAMYIDGGLGAVKEFLERCLFGKIGGFLEDESNVNYKSKLLEMSQHDGRGLPRYITTEATGPDHAKQFRVKVFIGGAEMGEGTGQSKKIAQQTAAQNACANYPAAP
ncbi:MAG: ribonuclease III [Chitinispirillales bacterium]|jgi:ribonuclease-3|nr:ribonuclease III [Chitinispirillales bacterium]